MVEGVGGGGRSGEGGRNTMRAEVRTGDGGVRMMGLKKNKTQNKREKKKLLAGSLLRKNGNKDVTS